MFHLRIGSCFGRNPNYLTDVEVVPAEELERDRFSIEFSIIFIIIYNLGLLNSHSFLLLVFGNRPRRERLSDDRKRLVMGDP
jgi:hypothetical protein